jgi:flagellar biosynthesis/type III secretory pathway protein FliH
MLLTEYNEARQMELFREEGREEGLKEGLKKGLREGHREGLREGHREGLREGHREGLREGQQKGQNMLAALISRLLSLGRTEDVARSASDPEYREKLFEEFKIRQD